MNRASHVANFVTVTIQVSHWPGQTIDEAYIGEIVVDGHDLGSIECPWCHEINLIEPTVLWGIRFHSASISVSENCEWSLAYTIVSTGALEHLHDAVLILADDCTSCMPGVCPMSIV